MPSRSLVLATTPAQLRSNPRDASTAFFFRRVVMPMCHGWPLGHEYFEHLLPLYNAAPHESALAIAVSAMALRVATTQHVQGQIHPLYAEAELTAVRAIKTALSDPRERLRDETLLAVLCLDYAQQLVPQEAARQDSRPHLKGALALVRQRDRASFASPVSQSLYVATRSHVLLRVLWSPNESEDQRLILTLPEVQPAGGENPALALHRILQRVLCLERLMLSQQPHDPFSRTGQDATSARANRAEALCSLLDEWRLGVSWAPAFPLSFASVERAEDASMIQQAFVFGQYLCTFTLALKLLFAETRLAVVTTHDDVSKETKLKAILARVQELVDSLRYAVIPVLEQGSRLVRSRLHEIDVNDSVEAVRPELVNGGIDGTAATVSRSHLLCLNTWLWAILTDEMPGAEDFGSHVEGVDDVMAGQT